MCEMNDSSPLILKNRCRVGGSGSEESNGVGVATGFWWSGDVGNDRLGIVSCSSASADSRAISAASPASAHDGGIFFSHCGVEVDGADGVGDAPRRHDDGRGRRMMW